MNAEASTSQHPTPIPAHAQPAGGVATASPSPTQGFKTPAMPVQMQPQLDGLRDPTTHPAFPPGPGARAGAGGSFPRESAGGIGSMFARPGGGSGSSSASGGTVNGGGGGGGNGMGVGGGGGAGPMMGTWGTGADQQQGQGDGSAPSSSGAGGSGPITMSALSAMMRNNGTGSPVPPPQPQNSPNFPSQLSPYSQPFSLPQYGSIGGVPMSLGMSVGGGGAMMGMSVSPHYGAAGGASFGNFGSYMQGQQWAGGGAGSVGASGSIGGPGWGGGGGGWMRQRHESFGAGAAGAERSRELEAKYVRDFTCCGLKLGGLHDLLEHYEECHVHLAPDLKKHSLTLASMEPSSATTQGSHQPLIQHPAHPPPHNISQPNAQPGGAQASSSFPSVVPSPFAARAQPPQPPAPMSAVSQPGLTKTSSPADSDAPGTPGMMDIDMMDEDEDPHAGPGTMQGQQAVPPSILPPTSAQWNSFQPPANVPQCVPPALLSYNLQGAGGPGSGAITPNRFPTVNGFGFPGSGMNVGGIHPAPSRDRTPGAGGSNGFLTEAQKAERAARKAARKEAKRIAKENGEYRSSDEDEDGGKRKKYRCPVEGCNKAYKQANGLKYHLNRSINSSHGHLANMPIPPPT